MSALLLVVLIVVLSYGVYGLSLYFKEKARLFGPTHKDREGKGSRLFKPWLSQTGQFLGYARQVELPRRLVLFFHGSGGEALDRAWAEELVGEKDLLVLVEYPGYGARSGQVRETEWLADAEKILAEAQATWGFLPVLAVGEGLGTSSAAYLASRGKAVRLALISPFASKEAVAAKSNRFFPLRWFLPDKIPTLSFLQASEVPLRMVHGTLDELVPLEHGRAVFQAYRGSDKAIDEVPGFGHSNLVQGILHSPFSSRFRAFIAE
jgi:pimeloyl-ACP methyl ester carboxylesterase